MGYVIGTSFHAFHHSGTRALSSIRLVVLHDMEDVHYLSAAENTGRWFASRASAGSAHYGTDNDSIERYLPLTVVPWGAPGANTDGVHIEQMGRAAWSAAEWHKRAAGTLDRTAWLLSHLHRHLADHGVRLPIRTLTDAELKNGKAGVTTHRQLTRVLGGTHTDPGTGYPLATVIAKATSHLA